MAGQKFKCELSSGKIVILHEFKIKTKNLAAQACANRGLTDAALDAVIQDEILKILIHKIDGSVPDPAKREDLDSLFEFFEYQELMLVIKDMLGINLKKPKVTVLTGSGD